jgi:hypothetical protein
MLQELLWHKQIHKTVSECVRACVRVCVCGGEVEREGEREREKLYFFFNPILFAVCTSTFNKLCKNMYTCIQWHVEECSIAVVAL